MQADLVDIIPAVLSEVHLLHQQAERAATAGDHASAVTTYTAALAQLPDPLDSDVRDLAYDLLRARATCYQSLGEYPAAEADLAVLLGIARDAHDLAREIDIVAAQVQVAIQQGKVATMQPAVEVLLERAQTAGDTLLEAAALAAMAEIGMWTNDYTNARAYIETALLIFKSHNNRRAIARMHWVLGGIDFDIGDFSPGYAHAETAVALYREVGDRKGEANALNLMSITTKDFAHKRDLCRQALAIFTELGERERQTMIYNNVGFLYLNLGLYNRAAAYLENALLSNDPQAHGHIAYPLWNLGILALARGAVDQAVAFVVQAHAYAAAAANEVAVAGCTLILGRAALVRGDLKRAAELLQEAANRYATLNTQGERAMALAWFGATCLARGDLAAAQNATAEATILLEAGADSEIAEHEVWWWRWKALTASETPHHQPSPTSGEESKSRSSA